MKTQSQKSNRKVPVLTGAQKFDWYSAWIATRSLAAVLGVIACVAYFATPLHTLALVSSALFLALMWFMFYRVVVALRVQFMPKAKPAADPKKPLAKFNQEKLREVYARLQHGIAECQDEVVRETLLAAAAEVQGAIKA